ncbi:MAG: ABC transporter substrate-binding protein [Bacillota bacterium]
MKNYLKISAIILLMVIFITSCGNQKPAVNNDKVLKIGVLLIDDSLPFFVAEQEKIFEKNNVKVELIPFNSAREKDMALEAGEIDGVLTDMVVTALLNKGGTDVKVVALSLGAAPQEGRFVILSSPQSNITKPEDLKGIPIAISNNTIIHYLAETMPLEVGLKREDIKTLSIPDLKLRFEALLAGKDVQAALLPDPLAALAEKLGAKPIIDDTTLLTNLSQSVIVFRGEVIKDHKEKVASILQAFKEASAEFMNNPDKYQDLRMEKTRVPEPLRGSYPTPVYSPLKVPSPEMVERIMKWMEEKKLLDEPYSYEQIVDNSLIE